ncbi:MAG: RHS repeat-associated core domain-containing protein [Patescibacteria group bacterium]
MKRRITALFRSPIRVAILLLAALLSCIFSANAQIIGISSLEESLFQFVTQNPVPEAPFGALSQGETIDMYTGGLSIFSEDLSIPGRLDRNLTVGHAFSSEEMDIMPSSQVDPEYPFVLEEHEPLQIGQPLQGISRHYGGLIDVASYEKAGEIVIDDLSPLGKIAYSVKDQKNAISWEPSTTGGVDLHWGEYAGIILITNVYPYGLKDEESGKLLGDRVAYLVHNDGTMELFDYEGKNISSMQKAFGLMRYFAGTNRLTGKPEANCKYYESNEEGSFEVQEPECERRYKVNWSNDNVDGIEYIDAKGNIFVFKGASSFLLQVANKWIDSCNVTTHCCSNGSTPDCAWSPSLGGAMDWEEQEVYPHNVPFYRIEGFRLEEAHDAFGNGRKYIYSDNEITIKESIGTTAAPHERNIIIKQDDSAWNVYGPMIDSAEAVPPFDRYEIDGVGRIVTRTNRAGETTKFIYDKGLSASPYPTPLKFSDDPRGSYTEEPVFVEVQRPTGAVFRYEQWQRPVDENHENLSKAVLVTSWPKSSESENFLQKQIVVDPPWEDTYDVDRITVSYDVDNSETAYIFEKIDVHSSIGGVPVLKKRVVRTDGGTSFEKGPSGASGGGYIEELFEYVAAKVGDHGVVRGISSRNLRYWGIDFVTNFQYGVGASPNPIGITNSDGLSSQFSYPDQITYSFQSPIMGLPDTVAIEQPALPSLRDDIFSDADGNTRTRRTLYGWGGTDSCGRKVPSMVLREYSVMDGDDGISISLCYDESGNIIKATRAYIDDGDKIEGASVSMGYGQLALYPESKKIGDAQWNYEHDSTGRTVKETNANGAAKQFVYDPIGRIRRTVYGTNGSFKEYSYNLPGTSEANSTLEIATFDQVRAKQSTDTLQYDGFGRILTEDVGGATRTYSYDGRGFLNSVSTQEGTKMYHHDAFGRISHVTSSDTGTVSYSYDALQTTWPAGRHTKAIRRAAYIGGQNIRNQYYSADGKLLRDERDAGGGNFAHLDFEYDALGNLIIKRSSGGQESKWIYDGLSRVASSTLATGLQMDVTDWSETGKAGTIVYEGTGQQHTFNYNHVWNGLEQASLGGDGIPYDVSFGYNDNASGRNGIGKLTSIDDPPGRTELYFNPSGGLSIFERTIDELESTYRVGMVSDVNGKLYRIAYSDGRAAYYLTDSEGRIGEVRLNSIQGPIVASFEYDGRNRLSRIRYGNNVSTSYNYVGDLLSEILIGKGSQELYHVEYSYDSRGRRTEAIYHDSGRTTYEYDGADRLTKTAYYKPNEDSPYNVQTYSYDADGNRLSYSDAYKTVSYVYDPSKPLLKEANYGADDGWKYGYDAFGRLSERKHVRAGETLESQKYTWNNAGQLVKVETLDPEGEVEAIHEYAYDNMGRREKRLRATTADYAIYGEFMDPISELNSDGEVDRDFVYMAGRRIAAIDGERIDFFHVDEIGSTLLTTDENAKTTAGYRYDPFGNVNFSLGDGSNMYGFAGKHYDDETGFIYFGGRYYDPLVGRFISPDPMNEGPNPYSYVANNPFGARDVFGWSMRRTGMWKGMSVISVGGGMDGGDMSGESGDYGEYGGSGYNNPIGGFGSGMDGPTGLPDGGALWGFIFGVAFSGINCVTGTNLYWGYSGEGSAMMFMTPGLTGSFADPENNDDEEDQEEGILPDDDPVQQSILGDHGTADESSTTNGTSGTVDSGSSQETGAGESGEGGSPVPGAPGADDSGTTEESWAQDPPSKGTPFEDSGIVVDIVDKNIAGDKLTISREETAGGLKQSNDTPGKVAQDGASSQSPDRRLVDKTDPITLHNAEIVNVEHDLKIPGRGIDFEFNRTYRSRIEYDGPMGYNWDHSYNKRLVRVDKEYCEEHPLDACCSGVEWDAKPEGYIACFVRFDGNARYDPYKYNDEGAHFEAPLGYFDRLTKNADGTTVIRDAKGTRHLYGADGLCTAIEDRFGNRIELIYEGTGNDKKLARVIDTLGRAIEFHYTGKRVTEVEDFSGRTWRYAYNSNGDLISVTEPATASFPEGSTTTYAYSSGYASDKEMLNHNLLSITDPLGQTYLAMAYSFTDRVIWQRFGEGSFTIESTMMGAWPACETQEEVDRVASRTRLTDRNGNERLYEYNCQGNALAVHVHTRGLRQGDPTEYVTRYTYDLNGLTTTAEYPAGNKVEIEYQQANSGDPTVDRLFSANTVRVSRIPDAARGGDPIIEERRYEPLSMQLMSETKDGITRTYWYDYQEGATLADLAAKMVISDETAQAIFAGVPLGQGDLNGDAATIRADGSLARLDEPVVHDIEGLAQSVRRQYRFNDFGRISAEIDPLGVETRYSYYGSGDQRGMLEKKVVDPANLALTTSYEYDAVGNMTVETDASGATTRYAYDERNRNIQVTNAAGAITTRFYDADGNLVRIDRPGDVVSGDLWITTKFKYNALNRPVLREDEASADRYVMTEFRYDLNENLIRTIKPEGNSAATVFDERDLPMTVKRGFESDAEATESYRYDSNGKPVEHTDGTGALTSYRYDGHDRLVETTDATNARIVTEYDAFDRPIVVSRYGVPTADGDPDTLLSREEAVHDEIGRTIAHRVYGVSGGAVGTYHETKYYYDSAGRKIREIDPLGNAKEFEYDAAGRLKVERDAVGNEKTYEYDGAGRPVEILKREIDELTASVQEFTEHITYDAMGRTVAREDPLGHVERFAYDGRGNLIWKSDAKGASGLDTGGDPGTGNVTQYKYDGLDRRVEEINEMRTNGAGSGSLIGTMSTVYAWDDNGNLASVTDAKGNKTGYAYDAQDRRVHTEMPDGALYAVEYDKASRPTRMIDPRGIVVRNIYDGAGRLDTRNAYSGAMLTRSDEFEYDGLGRMLSAESRDGSDALISHIEESFDSFGRNDQSRQDGIAVTRIYDASGCVLTVGGQNGITAVYDRDSAGRISTISEASLGTLAQIEHLGRVGRSRATLGNGLVQEMGYDSAARSVTNVVRDPAAQLLAGFEAGYDRAGNRLYEKRQHDVGKGEVFAFDSLYRLTQASDGVVNPETFAGQTTPTNYDRLTTWTIDDVHNWTARVDYRNPADPAQNLTQSYAVNALNQYPTVSASLDSAPPSVTSFIYDEAGNLISDGIYEYTYDDRNLVTEVRDASDASLVARYAYDALKRRTSELRADGTVKQFVYDNWQEVQEITDGVLTASFVYDDGIDRPVAMITDDGVYYYHTDSRNNIAMVSDGSGAVVERYTYDPYGKATIKDGAGNPLAASGIDNAYLFSSRRHDEATGLYYYRNRMYSPALGRFLQRDPIGYQDGMNVYIYAGDNPIIWIDPYGLEKTGYININIAVGKIIGVTGGYIGTLDSGHFYFGGGFIPVPGVSITFSADDIAEGWNVEFQGGYGIGGSVGFSLEGDGDFAEVGAMSPGGSLTIYYVW